MFFLTLEEGLVSEQFSVGNHTIRNDLLILDGDTFVPTAGVEVSFLSRRSDFMGASLSVLMDTQAPYLTVPEGDEAAETTTLRGGTPVEVIRPDKLTGMFWQMLVSE